MLTNTVTNTGLRECFIGRLAPQQLAQIFLHLDSRTLVDTVPHVCKTWKQAVHGTESVWLTTRHWGPGLVQDRLLQRAVAGVGNMCVKSF